jgi:hypothetical protein
VSYVAEHPWVVTTWLIALFLGVTTFRIAWREDWGWAAGLLLAAIPVALIFFCPLWGLLGAGVFVGKLYKSYG